MAIAGQSPTLSCATIERLESLGYTWVHGSEVEREGEDEVVLRTRLREALIRRYPGLPTASLEEAVAKLSRPEDVDPLRRNCTFHQLLTRGFEVRVEQPGGHVEHTAHPSDRLVVSDP